MWSFRTSTLEDFESLARRLQPHQAAGSPVGGTRTAFAGQPGYFAGFADPRLAVEMEGALQSPTWTRATPIIQRTVLTPRLEATLSEVVESEIALPAAMADPDADDPLLSLPVYGRTFAQPDDIRATAPQPAWVHQVNLDLRLRLVAGAGARIVKRHQEEFMQICWGQVGEILEANRRRARRAVAAELTQRLVNRHLVPLPAETALRLAAPLFDLLPSSEGSTPAGGARPSVAAELDRKGIAPVTLQPAARRLAAKRPVRDLRGRSPSRVVVQNPPVPGVDSVVAPRRAPATTLSSARASRAAALTAARARSGLLALVPEPLAATETFTGFEVPVAEVGRVEPSTIVTAARQLLVELPIRKAGRLLEGLRELGAGEPRSHHATASRAITPRCARRRGELGAPGPQCRGARREPVCLLRGEPSGGRRDGRGRERGDGAGASLAGIPDGHARHRTGSVLAPDHGGAGRDGRRCPAAAHLDRSDRRAFPRGTGAHDRAGDPRGHRAALSRTPRGV